MSANEPIKLDSLVIEEKSKNVNKDEDIVNPWSISAASDSGVDYDKLIGNYFLINLNWRLSFRFRDLLYRHIEDHEDLLMINMLYE